jgi:putative nucleotidyltransferase with HDIG domain
MSYSAWAEQIARTLLQDPLPRRWAHVQGVAATAWTLAPVLGADGDLLTAAAWLHDIGYAYMLASSGFHPLDGARYLRDIQHADPVLCRLVAHHSGAITEAAERGLADELAREFKPARPDLADALIYCDLTTGPDGQRLSVEQRLADIHARYDPAHPVSRAMTRSGPQLAAAVARVTRQLSGATTSAGIAPALAGLA